MDSAQFEQALAESGFKEIATRSLEPRPANGDHAHEFTARGLVTAGEFIVSCGGVPRSYKAGEIFEVAAGEMHNEAVGPEGACVTTGRKY